MTTTTQVDLADLSMFLTLARFTPAESRRALNDSAAWANEAQVYRLLRDAGYTDDQMKAAFTALCAERVTV